MHLVAQCNDLNIDMARYKPYTATQLIQYLKTNQVKLILDQLAFYKKGHKTDRKLQLWQQGCHPELIQGQGMMKQKVAYTHQNPVNRGYVYFDMDWRYSSARNFTGKDELLYVCCDW